MEKYRILFKKSVAKDLRKIPKKEIRAILTCFDSLTLDPRGAGCEKLSGQERYRLRREACRIIYEIHDDVLLVVVVKVGHRRDVYRGS